MIIEPMLLGAGGMIVYPAEYLKGVWELSRKYNVHLIADEVATGFGRTGKMFACEHAGVEPDFMCLSKGITSGYLPMGATLTTEEVYRAFYDNHDKFKTFYHGHTYTANPVSCAAACASIDLFKENNVLENAEKINRMLTSFLHEMSELSIVKDTRCIGVVGAMELSEGISGKIYKEGLRKNLLLRPLGNITYFFLPLCTTPDDLKDIFKRTGEILRATNREFSCKICATKE
jgi:adenosylmethionine-8-amino-7-oxononanoate aminotransferase